MRPVPERMRFDLEIIASWIEPGSKVIDLGCGEGDLLLHLITRRGVQGRGIERSEEKVAHCIERGLTVLQGDINEEVHDYPEGGFDYVILSQTLQQVYEPDVLIRAMLRIGRRGIVSFPNFGHWDIRRQVFFTGFAPVTRQLPYQWYDTPNIRVISLKDFRRFVDRVGLHIRREAAINTHSQDRHGRIVRVLANLRATYGIFLIEA